jgi:hypothetical protein
VQEQATQCATPQQSGGLLLGQQTQQQDGEELDNPDQRIASDAAELCDSLAALAKVAAAAPFKLLYYRWDDVMSTTNHHL